MLRRLYDAVITLSEKKSAPWYMGAVSFAESSFFPIPPDAMLVPMALARPDRAYRPGVHLGVGGGRPCRLRHRRVAV